MDIFTVSIVLLSALFHAGWNTLVKRSSGDDPFRAIVLTSGFAGLLALPILVVYGLPERSSWLFLAYGVSLQLPYYLSLSKTYAIGEVGQTYPIVRGSAAFFAVTASLFLAIDALGMRMGGGLLLLCGGVAALAWRGSDRFGRANAEAIKSALLTGTVIATYSIINGIGVRRSGNPIGYASLFFLAEGLMMIAFGLGLRGRALLTAIDLGPRGVVGSGTLAFASYSIALWASTKLPIATVAALRETSVLFAAALAVLVLKEQLYVSRLIGAGLVFSGLALAKSG